MSKIKALQTIFSEKDLDVCFIDDPVSITLLTGFQSEPHERILAALLTGTGKKYLFTPALDQAAAQKATTDWEVFSYHDSENPWKVIAEKLRDEQLPFVKWAVEKNHLTVSRLEKLQQEFPSAQFTTDLTPIIDELKMIKDQLELEKMQKAGYWADEALKIGARVLREGITEAEVVAHIERELKEQGVKEMSFDTMVLFGANAALPHGVPGSTRLEKNQFVLFDLGVVCEGYASDVTRTLFFGDSPSVHQREVYALVLNAHDRAMKEARVGMTASTLDRIAREIIEEKGYGEAFNHRLGHGLGQSIHEYPSIVAGNELDLRENMCFSIEPGIYLEGQIGVRIEDCGYMTEDGFIPFTHFPTQIDAYTQTTTSE